MICINNKYRKKTTLKHEIKNVQQTLDTIPICFDNKEINIIGDKGYISREKFTVGKHNLAIITPKRRNQKIQNTDKEKEILKGRHKIENLFATLKNSERISNRKETNISNYMGFVYLGCLKYIFQYNETHSNIEIKTPMM